MHICFAIAALILSVTTVYAQHAGHQLATTKQISNRAARNANQALDKITAPSALPPQPLVPGADATMPGLSQPGLYDNPALTNPPQAKSQPYDPGSIHYPYGRTALGNVDPASRANPYGPYATAPGSAYGHYGVLPQTQNTLFGNPAPAFGINQPGFGVNNAPVFNRGR